MSPSPKGTARIEPEHREDRKREPGKAYCQRVSLEG